MFTNKMKLNGVRLLTVITSVVGIANLASAGNTPKKKMVCEHVRAAFDVGSSSTKMKVFKIDICKQKILEQLFPKTEEDDKAARAELDFAGDLMLSRKDPNADPSLVPYFSSPIMMKAEKEFARLKELAKPFKPESYVGVATQAFREARNAEDVVIVRLKDRLGIKVLVPLQEQEALLEWLGATAYLDDPTASLSKVVTWGIGGGSMQVGAKDANGKFITWASGLASTNMMDVAFQGLQRDAKSLLPVTSEEMAQMIKFAEDEAINSASSDLKNRINGFQVAKLGVGGVINKSIKGTLINLNLMQANAPSFSRDQVKRAAELLTGIEANDSILAKVPEKLRNQTITNVALVLGVMQGLNISEVYFSPIDNTFAAPFAAELGIKMSIRKLKEGIPLSNSVAPWQKAAAVMEPTALPAGTPVTKAATPPPAPVQITAENSVAIDDGAGDENYQACVNMGITPVNGVCEVTTIDCIPTCTGKVDAAGKCTIPGKTQLVFKKVCQ